MWYSGSRSCSQVFILRSCMLFTYNLKPLFLALKPVLGRFCKSSMLRKLWNVLLFLYYYRCVRPFCAICSEWKPFLIIRRASYESLPDLDIKFFCFIFVPDGYETESYDVRRVREHLRSDDVCRPLRYLHDCRYYNPCGGLVCFFRQKHFRMHTRPRLPGRKPGF